MIYNTLSKETIKYYHTVHRSISYLGCNLTSLNLDQQILKVNTQFLNVWLKVHSFAEEGGTIRWQESILGKDLQ